MSMIEAVILGLLQGVSEFLPVSSSGHLLLAKRWFGLAEIPILFDLALHLATLGAVVLLFRQTIARLFLVLIRWVARKSLPSDRSDLSYIALILIATMITAVMGLLLKDLALPARLVYAGFLYTSTLLIISTRFIKRGEVSEPIGEAGWLGNTLRGIIIGFLQGLAVLPGISRSGSTISGALFCGITRERAGELSFLLSIPAIVGGFILTLREGQGEDLLAQMDLLPLLVALVVAFASGYFALRLLMRLVKEMKLHYFAFYLIPLAILGLFGILP
ncbi:undecaprenyl-diphosphate phosphatase [Entomospira culicis]|uniref:Undecaprenyl-diphosphatase n=1 Tax=Entomospira culicis TaxID=2719989 RepID=A0A968GG03_9SPIO|nr:undecaprenyl-diphosphate phosphatase [Entomospira culicis]NIZ19261.1 undecaprenyl-diphosphate phosphatase [Entomospira culicis]NIZ69834.1 undecaprenyl-diphosphate phosphatase [Entomospira culicis]WDI36940.1 undecaprenyl-diphosphate phosphatase [Entomospira culicis]WDI38569.1 undecaprenyl-diphosphate phosphatase [Entomospira culicis]